MSSANDRQVGGDHYPADESGLKHWDMIEDHGIGYLEGCATKYLRFKTDRLQDLEKGLHYTEKLIEMASSFNRFPRGYVPANKIVNFVIANGYGDTEHVILTALLRWTTVSDLRFAVQGFQRLIEQEKNQANDPATTVRSAIDVDASGDGEPAGLDLSASCGCGCGDEGRTPEGSGDRG